MREYNKVDFVGVKIGEVDMSSDPASSSRRVTDALTMNVTDQVLRGGETYRVDVRSDNFEDIHGLQYTLSYADAYVSVESIEPGALRVTEDHYYRYGPGMITSSWNT